MTRPGAPFLRKQVQARDGDGWPGEVEAHEPGEDHPGKTRHQARARYCLPITLWSRLKTCFANKAGRRRVMLDRVRRHIVHLSHLYNRDVPCTALERCRPGYCIAASFFSHYRVFLRHHFQVGLHVVVPEATKLGADDFVLARPWSR